MILAGSGLAMNSRADDAAVEASLSAMDRSGAERAEVALVFTGDDAGPCGDAVLHGVRRITGAPVVVGCGGAGVLTESGEAEGLPAVAVLAISSGGRLLERPFLVRDRAELGAGAAAELAQAAGPAVAEGGCLLIVPDAANLDARGLLDGLADQLGPVPVVGGVAAGADLFELYNTDVVRGALAGLAVSGEPPVIGVAQGCEPIGEPYVITRCERNVVQAIAGRSPLAMLREAVRSVPDYEARLPRAGVFAGLTIDPAKSPLGRGDFLIRNLVGIDQESGAVSIAEMVRAGQTLQFHIRDAQAAREDLDAMLTRVSAALGGRRPAFGVYFNCAGRGQGLYGAPDHDVTCIRKRLGEWPLIGFFGNGEFAPVGGRNFFHNYTGVLVVFPQP
jgi:small ligand-binding sensory domain FIST